MMKHHYVKWGKHILRIAGYGLMFFFLVLNIIYSQDMPVLYSKLVREEESAFVEFMRVSKDLPIFSRIRPEIESSYQAHNSQIYQEERNRAQTITKLEMVLMQNPRATEVLYSLYLLYQKDGDTQKAENYFRRAQELDPMLER